MPIPIGETTQPPYEKKRNHKTVKAWFAVCTPNGWYSVGMNKAGGISSKGMPKHYACVEDLMRNLRTDTKLYLVEADDPYDISVLRRENYVTT